MINLKQYCAEVSRPPGSWNIDLFMPPRAFTRAHALCAASFLCVLFSFFNAALDRGRENTSLCVAAAEGRFVGAPRENGAHSW